MLGFGALFGLVTQHAVGTQKHAIRTSSAAQTAARGASTFFDANGASYSFDDRSLRAAQQNTVASASQVSQQPAPVAQSSGS